MRAFDYTRILASRKHRFRVRKPQTGCRADARRGARRRARVVADLLSCRSVVPQEEHVRSTSLFFVAGALLLSPNPSRAGDRITGREFATRSEVYAPHAMAATSQPLVTQIALDVMRRGGSAVDAAIAADAALGLMEPTGSGMGGDLFAIVWDPKTHKLYGYNGSGRSPKSLSLADFQKRGLTAIPPYGPLPVTVPGAVDAWFALHDRFGKLPMPELLAPTIKYAREGFPVSEVIAYYWSLSVPRLSKYPGFSEQ